MGPRRVRGKSTHTPDLTYLVGHCRVVESFPVFRSHFPGKMVNHKENPDGASWFLNCK